MTALIKYEAACLALAECKAVDEVKSWVDKAAAMHAYGRMAKDKTLEVDAAEIRIRAERRLGELIAAQKASLRDESDRIQAWVARARATFSPGTRQPCEVCGRYADFTHAHHLTPLSRQVASGAETPDQAFVWLCPTHHAAVHVALGLPNSGALAIFSLEEVERNAVLCVAGRSAIQ